MTASVTGRLAALVGDASYATALAIAKAMPGHGSRKSGRVGRSESDCYFLHMGFFSR